MKIGLRIKELRKDRGLSQKQLAKILEVSEPMISQYESKNSNLRLDTIKKIAKALQVDYLELLEIDNRNIEPQCDWFNGIDVYKIAIEKYGVNAQLDMVIEEMSELTKEICKKKRGKDNHDEIVEEMADVYIMLEQLKTICGIWDIEIIKQMELKTKRLEERLK